MSAREAASRPHLGLPAGGNRHRETTGDHQDRARGDDLGCIQNGTQIKSGRLFGLVGGQDCTGIESLEPERRLGHVLRVSPRGTSDGPEGTIGPSGSPAGMVMMAMLETPRVLTGGPRARTGRPLIDERARRQQAASTRSLRREPRVRRYHLIGTSPGAGSETTGVQPTRHVDARDAASGGLLHRRAGDRRRDPTTTFASDDDDFMPALWIRPSPTPQRHRLPRVRNRGGTHRPGPGGRSGPSELPRMRPPARESPMERDLP